MAMAIIGHRSLLEKSTCFLSCFPPEAANSTAERATGPERNPRAPPSFRRLRGHTPLQGIQRTHFTPMVVVDYDHQVEYFMSHWKFWVS